MAKEKAKRSTIGASPLDTVVPATRPTRTKPDAAPEPSESSPKERLTLHVSSDLAERLRDAVYWTPGLTMAGLAEDALSKAIDGMEKRNGGPFKKRTGKLTLGRPTK